MRFRWPVPLKLQVTEARRDKNRDATTRYTATLSRLDAERSILRLSDFEFLAFGELDLSKPKNRERLKPALLMASALPALIVDNSGRFAGVDYAPSRDHR